MLYCPGKPVSYISDWDDQSYRNPGWINQSGGTGTNNPNFRDKQNYCDENGLHSVTDELDRALDRAYGSAGRKHFRNSDYTDGRPGFHVQGTGLASALPMFFDNTVYEIGTHSNYDDLEASVNHGEIDSPVLNVVYMDGSVADHVGNTHWAGAYSCQPAGQWTSYYLPFIRY